MIKVEIPVSPLSRKILISQYGAGPITLKAHDIHFQKFCYQHPRLRSNLQKLREKLTETIVFRFDTAVKYRLQKNGYHIGYHLDCYHLQMMMEHVYASYLVNIPVASALRIFYEMNDITEDDYAHESAYRRWGRFKRSKIDTSASNISKGSRQVVRRDYQYCKVLIPPPDGVLDQQINTFCENNFNLFLNSKKQFDEKRFKQLVIYTYHTIGKRTVAEIMKLMNVSQSNVYYCIDCYRNLIAMEEQYNIALNDEYQPEHQQTA